jgi:hypothetical protein
MECTRYLTREMKFKPVNACNCSNTQHSFTNGVDAMHGCPCYWKSMRLFFGPTIIWVYNFLQELLWWKAHVLLTIFMFYPPPRCSLSLFGSCGVLFGRVCSWHIIGEYNNSMFYMLIINLGNAHDCSVTPNWVTDHNCTIPFNILHN